MKLIYIIFICLPLMYTSAFAGQADIIKVEIRQIGGDTYNFDVTVRHADEGWEHFANKWEVTAPDGTILGTRILAHPHVEEQPFTRSLSGVKIPENIAEVTVRAHDLVHGYGDKTLTVRVPGK
jgi:hypothetical protein